jgi:hypothetical protein
MWDSVAIRVIHPAFSHDSRLEARLGSVSTSANTIKRNEFAYQIYSVHRQKPIVSSLPRSALRDLASNVSAAERHGLQSKIWRLRSESKDALIAKLVSLERAAA